MMASNPEQPQESPGGDIAFDPADSVPGPNHDEVPDPADPGLVEDSAEDREYNETAAVINNFYSEVAASTIGVSAGAGSLARLSIRRESGKLKAQDVRRDLRYYVEPNQFSHALEILKHNHLVALAGPEGSGRKAATLQFARKVCPNTESYTVLPPTRSLPELASSKGYHAGQVYLLHDWVPIATDSRYVAHYDLNQLVARLTDAEAYMAFTLGRSSHLQALLGELSVPWSAPDAVILLKNCIAKLPDLQLDDNSVKKLVERAGKIQSPRAVIKLAESACRSVETALSEAGETESSAVAAWFEPNLARWKVLAVTVLTFLSGVSERKFERELTALTEIEKSPLAQSDDDKNQGEARKQPDENTEFRQSRWMLANSANLEAFINARDSAATVGSEHRPAFCTKEVRLQFMIDLNVRYGDELWSPVRDWLFALADQPFGEAQVAAGYGLALLARCSLQDVQETYLTPWSAGNIRNRLMAVNVLWAMVEDDLCAPEALRIAVSWVWNGGRERAITAAIAVGGPLGERYPDEAMRWLWTLSLRGEQIGKFARAAMSQLFATEVNNEVEKSIVLRFILRKIHKILSSDASTPEARARAFRSRRSALSVVNSVLNAILITSDVPVVVSVLRARSADFRPIGELWATVLNSVPHRSAAIRALHLTLVSLAEKTDASSVEIASKLGVHIMPRLTARTIQVLKQSLSNPDQAKEISASIFAAFLGARRPVIGEME